MAAADAMNPASSRNIIDIDATLISDTYKKIIELTAVIETTKRYDATFSIVGNEIGKITLKKIFAVDLPSDIDTDSKLRSSCLRVVIAVIWPTV
jgi:hypothetical protein